jgi:hypothetical protein
MTLTQGDIAAIAKAFSDSQNPATEPAVETEDDDLHAILLASLLIDDDDDDDDDE